MPPGFRDSLTGLGWLDELDSESLELDPDPEPELSESRAAPWEKGPVESFEFCQEFWGGFNMKSS